MVIHWSSLLSVALVVGMALPAWGQDANDGGVQGDPLGGPSEYGIRFTPGMARVIGRTLAREILIERYGMDEAKAEQASELLARRFMAFAHEHEDAGQEILENLIVQGLEMDATNRAEGYQGISKGMAQELAKRMPAMMPAIRGAMVDAANDVRPLLPLKGQLQLTGEVALANVALDAFEKNLDQWSKGELRPFTDPFRDPAAQAKKGADGETRELKEARQAAERANRLPVGWFASYLEEAKKYYQFDASQAAAGDSLLRDYSERLKSAMGGEEQWRSEVPRDRFWMTLAMEMPGRWNNPLCAQLWERFWKRADSLRDLREEFAAKVEEIATQGQRDAAERRVQEALKAKGYEWAAPPAAPAETVPASAGE